MGGAGLIVANATVKPPSPARRTDVFVAAVPLRATKGPPQLLMSTAYSLSLLWDLQHFMVLCTPTDHPSQVLVFDFQPEDPESIYAALAALSGRKIPDEEDEKIAKNEMLEGGDRCSRGILAFGYIWNKSSHILGSSYFTRLQFLNPNFQS